MSEFLLPFVAVVAGVVSFSSPCCVPLVPGYISYVSSLPVSELGQREARALTLKATSLFVAGFTVIFTLLGLTFSYVGSALLRNAPMIVRIAGFGIIVMGLAMAGVLRVPLVYRERRFDLGRVPRGPGSAFVLGMAFALGWTPCVGPVLATILTAASATQTAVWGALLLALYSVGLGLPFVLLALGFQRARGSLDWLQRQGRRIETLGGLLLVVVGVLFVSGVWQSLFVPLQRSFARLGWPPI